MEQTDYGFLCKIRSTGRVSHRAGELTYLIPSSTPDAVISHLREGTVPSTGGNVLTRQESDRGTLSHVALPRILQSNLLGSQERRWLATGVRLKVTESLRMQGEILDDQSPSSDKCITSRELGHKCRFKRRLLPHPHTSQVQTPAPLCHSREQRAPSFSIQSPAVRSDIGAKGIYPSVIWHTHAVCLLQYLDDWILRNTDKSLLVQQTSWLLRIMRTGAKCAKVAVSTNPLGRLHLRPMQLYLLAHWSPASKDMAALIPVKHNLLDHHLHWWLNRKYTRAGMLLDIPEAQTQLFTDASESGWGVGPRRYTIVFDESKINRIRIFAMF